VDNPLKKFFPVEERADGSYIKVTREVRDALHIEDVAVALEQSFVTNADVAKIKDVVSRARGGFEKIGVSFEYYNADLDKFVDINFSPLLASMRMNSAVVTNGIKISEASLLYCLKRKGIVHGIKHNAVKDVVVSKLFDKDIEIAVGKPAENGADAKLIYEIDLDKAIKPQEDDKGKVDFRNINSIAQVASGQSIAHKEPPGKGVAGIDVNGKEIPPVPGNDIIVRGGKNTVVSEDGKILKATASGYIYKQDDVVNVSEQLSIKNDVDFSVGNIKFTGDIQIQGNVLPGFTIETGGNIAINGEVESAKIISRNGSVHFGKGIVGKNDMLVTAKQDVNLVFAQASTITAENEIVIDKFCMHCALSGNVVKGTHPHSAIIGGTCMAFSHIETGTVGNDKGIETRLQLFDKEEHALIEKITQLETLEQKLQTELDPINKQLHTKAAIFKQAGAHITARQAEEMKKWIDAHNQLAAKVKFVQDKIKGLKEDLKKPRDRKGYIKISGDIFPGTELNLYGITKLIKEKMSNKLFRVHEGAVGTEG